jgi:DNA-binding response OmpR family regulator
MSRPARPTSPNSDFASLRGLYVVVVGGDAPGASRLATILEYCGAQVSTFATASRARRLLRHVLPDVVIIDVPGLPWPSPDEVVEELPRPWFPAGRRLVIALSAEADEITRAAALAAGFDECLAKSIEPRQFSWLLGRLARQANDRRGLS